MKYTGERMIPEFNLNQVIYFEHIIRYKFIQQFLKPQMTVLDVACGSGYGSYLIAKKVKNVIGIDISKAAIKYAQEKYHYSNIKYINANLSKRIPLEDKSIDLIVSFETLEHLEDQDKFLQELKRVSKDDALLVISTPNKEIFTTSDQKFHKKELSFQEFSNLLEKYFSVRHIIKQSSAGVTFIHNSSLNLINLNSNLQNHTKFYMALCTLDKQKIIYENLAEVFNADLLNFGDYQEVVRLINEEKRNKVKKKKYQQIILSLVKEKENLILNLQKKEKYEEYVKLLFEKEKIKIKVAHLEYQIKYIQNSFFYKIWRKYLNLKNNA